MEEGTIAGKTALVTGAARRIGREIAVSLAEAGVNVVIHYRSSAEEAENLRAELIRRGVQAWLVQADFERLPESRELFENSVRCAGSIDFLINNASSFISRTVREIEFADLVRDIQINAWSPFVLSREFARHFSRGKIVNLIDTRVSGYDHSHIAYILSKKLLLSLTEMLAIEFAPHISVNAVAPGLILPPAGKDECYLNQLAHRVPLQKHGGPGDINETVLYFLRSDFVTGQVIFVDGGRHLKRPNDGSHHNQ
jgi:pteridine reductase